MSSEIIIGIHSVANALKNPMRKIVKLFLNEEGKVELQKKYNLQAKNFPSEVLKNHILQETAKKLFEANEHKFSRIPTGLVLETSPLEEYDINWIYTQVEKPAPLKILCLDQVTDVHNGGAIFRTAAFYGVNIILLPEKGSFGLSPGFYRISSGAREFIQIVRINSFPKIINKLQDKGVEVVALSEHAEQSLEHLEPMNKHRLLILGAEETGISHALLRIVKKQMRIEPKGQIESLNVSVAAAVAMQKCF